MRKLIIFSALGTSLAIAGGVGLSTAHTMGFFGPAQTDWVKTSRIAPPLEPRSLTPEVEQAVPTVSPALQPDMPVSVTPPADELIEVVAPAPVATPQVRPSVIEQAPVQAVVAPAPQLRQVAPVPQIAPQAKAPRAVQPAPRLVSPPGVTAEADPIDRVWLLGVYR